AALRGCAGWGRRALRHRADAEGHPGRHGRDRRGDERGAARRADAGDRRRFARGRAGAAPRGDGAEADLTGGPNVWAVAAAARQPGPAMVELSSREHKVRLGRELWIAVMEAQRVLGVDIPAHVIDDYRAVIDHIDLASIEARERVTRHDVKARIEEFSELAGH